MRAVIGGVWEPWEDLFDPKERAWFRSLFWEVVNRLDPENPDDEFVWWFSTLRAALVLALLENTRQLTLPGVA